MKISLTIFLSFFLLTGIWAQQNPQISEDEINLHIKFLASDSLKGRKSGTPESWVAADYIRKQFENSGLRLLADEGFQYFEVVTGIGTGGENELIVDDQSYNAGRDFSPLSFSESQSLSAPAVFVGFGLDFKNDSIIWNDYEGLDVNGKWAIVLRGAPEIEGWNDVFPDDLNERIKVLTAKDRGAAGVIFVNGIKNDPDDNLMTLNYDKSASTAGIPVIQVKRNVMDDLLSRFGRSVSDLESEIVQNIGPIGFALPVVFSANVDIIQEKSRTRNVVAVIEGGSSDLKDEYVVIGAHYDHLGTGGPGSGSRMPDIIAVHNGADDNASGVAGLIELAGYFSDEAHRPSRSLIFVAFGAEESGLIGSKFFVANLPVDKRDITAMVNLDMIGRLKDHQSVSVGGVGTSDKSLEILEKIEKQSALQFIFSREGYGPSDHAAFYAQDIPVFFITTGAHEDYHTPYDDSEKINAAGQKAVLEFTAGLISDVANRDNRLVFMEAGPKTAPNQRTNFKVTLGIMPDFASSENDGLRVDAVRPDGPAFEGGMKKGDKIVAIDGKPIGGIYEYMGRLRKLVPGQMISVDVLRKGKKEVLIIQL